MTSEGKGGIPAGRPEPPGYPIPTRAQEPRNETVVPRSEARGEGASQGWRRVSWVPSFRGRAPLRVSECRRVSLVHLTRASHVEHAPTSQLPPVAGRDLPPLRGGQQPVVPRSEARGEGTRKRSAAGRGLLNAGDGCLVCHLSRMGAVASLRVPAGLGCSPHRVVPR